MTKKAKKYRGVQARNDSIRISFTFKGGRRREKIRQLPTATNLKAADALRNEINQRVRRGDFTLDDYKKYFPDSKWLQQVTNAAPRQSFHGIMDRWLEIIRPRLRPTTIHDYLGYIKRFKAEFSDYPTTLDIRAWISKQQNAGLKRKTIHNRMAPLRGALDMATEAGILEYNPVSKITRLKKSREEEINDVLGKGDINPFDIDELEILLKAARDFPAFPQMYNMVLFWAFSGLRTGEVFALPYELVDLHKATAEIKMSCTNGEYSPPKTKAGHRTIELLPEALAALKRQKDHTFMQKKVAYGQFGSFRPVFRNAIGEPFVYSQNFWRYWNHLLRKAGVPYRRPYQLRHTFASMAIASGESEEWVAKQLGHTDTSMVQRHYKKYLKEAQKRAGREGGESIRALIGGMGWLPHV